MTTATISVAPGLAFEFRRLDPRLLKRVAAFLDRAPTEAFIADALVISDASPRGDETSSPTPLLERDGIKVARGGDTTFFDTASGAHAWSNARTGDAGIQADNLTAAQLDSFVGQVLASLLMDLAEARDWFGLHAAGAQVNGHGLLLAGPSGVGKSTLIDNLHRAGHPVLSDDLLWLEPRGHSFVAHAFPRTKAYSTAPRPTLEECPLGAIICPTIVDRDASTLRPSSTGETLDVLLSQSGFLGAAASSAKRFKAMVRLTHALPGLRLEAGRRQEEIPPLLADLTFD